MNINSKPQAQVALTWIPCKEYNLQQIGSKIAVVYIGMYRAQQRDYKTQQICSKYYKQRLLEKTSKYNKQQQVTILQQAQKTSTLLSS